MDNFFDILIYLIIIISIVSSFLKKKQPPKKTSERRVQSLEPEQADVQVLTEQPKEEYDILKEIEGFFKVGNEKPGAEVTPPENVEPKKRMTQIEEQNKSEGWHTPTASEHVYTQDWEIKERELKEKISQIDSGVEKQAAKFEESLQRKEIASSQLAFVVKSKLGNPTSLKEYIILSEILGKPKALRR